MYELFVLVRNKFSDIIADNEIRMYLNTRFLAKLLAALSWFGVREASTTLARHKHPYVTVRNNSNRLHDET